MKTNFISGAGIICYFDNRDRLLKKFKEEIIYLILENFDSSYDFTKGTINPGEEKNPIQCALRETYEESDIDSFDFVYIHQKPISINSSLLMYLGELKSDVLINNAVKLKVNATINSPEHANFYFLEFDSAIKKLPDYLKQYLVEADAILNNSKL